MSAKWLDGFLGVVRGMLQVTGKSASANAEQALAKAREELDSARSDRSNAEAALSRLMAVALDGEVTAADLQSQQTAVVRARQKVEQLEGFERALVDKYARARSNDAARDRATLEASFRKDMDEATAELREAFACDQRKAGCFARGWAALERARSKGQQLGIDRWPTLWSRDRLVRMAEIDLVRTAPEIFRFSHVSYGQALQIPDFETQHRAAVAEILPPNPTPRPVAA